MPPGSSPAYHNNTHHHCVFFLSLSLSSLYYDIAQLSTDYVELQMNDSW